ncbi:MAG: AEC family transporter, partial [Atopobiaceae bacterium]|nr:AEC family transporter [Atopobiaceae bacterium]
VLILIKQILVMLLMMSVGMVLYKIGQIDEKGVGQLSNLALYVATPCVVLQALAIEFDAERLVTGGWVMLFFMIIFVVSVVIARVFCGSADRVGQFAVVFSNSGFVGIPLIQGILGDEYVFYVTMTMVAGTATFWTYGVYLMSGDKNEVSIKKILTNPNLIAIVIGLIFFFAPIKLPYVLQRTVAGMANMNTGLGMIILGATLGASNIGLMIRDTRLYKATALRLVVVPLACIPILMLMPVPFEVRMVMMIIAAAPAASATSMLALKYGADYSYGTGLAIGTTIISMLTMPLVLALAMMVL